MVCLFSNYSTPTITITATVHPSTKTAISDKEKLLPGYLRINIFQYI